MRKTKPVELQINRGTIVDQVASFLHATHQINDHKEIVDIEFSDTASKLVNLKVYTRKEVARKH